MSSYYIDTINWTFAKGSGVFVEICLTETIIAHDLPYLYKVILTSGGTQHIRHQSESEEQARMTYMALSNNLMQIFKNKS